MKVLRISSMGDLQKADNFLKRVRKQMPIIGSEVMMKFGRKLETNLKMAAREAGLTDFTGTLQNKGIRYEQKRKGKVGYLYIRQYGIFQDSMKSHHVNITKRRSKLLQWALLKGRGHLKINAQRVASGELKKTTIFVRKHPFIMNGWKRTRKQLRPMLARQTRKVLHAR